MAKQRAAVEAKRRPCSTRASNSRRKWAGARTTVMFAGDIFADKGILFKE
jgi:hypothetical protein